MKSEGAVTGGVASRDTRAGDKRGRGVATEGDPGRAGGPEPGVGFRPPVLLLLALVVLAIWLLFLEPIGQPPGDPSISSIPAGGADDRLVVALEPDSVRVGEPFVLGVTMRTDPPGEIRFPPLLPLSEELEQIGGAEIRSSEDQSEWRAYYPLVAWRAAHIEIPEFSLGAVVPGAGAPREVLVRPPAVEVLSVLPDSAEEELELREARPLLRIRGPSWMWLLLALLALAPLWWWWRRRLSPARIGPPLSPSERALQALAELRGRSKRGELRGAELFDGIEGALRGYVAATRGWRPSQTLGALGRSDEGLAVALASSALARFARLRTSLRSSLAAIDAAIGFVRRDSEPRSGSGLTGAENATPEDTVTEHTAAEHAATESAAPERTTPRGAASGDASAGPEATADCGADGR